MTIGRKNGKLKIKTGGNAGLRAVSCGCCGPLPTPCNFFHSTIYQNYLDDPDSLPDEIYLGGTRQFTTRTLIPDWPDPPPITGTFWGGVSGGMLLSRSGTGYGNTTNGVILEPVDPDNPSAAYTWAIYKNGVRSVADWLIDGINRHDNLPTSYQVIMNCTGNPLVISPERFSQAYGGPRTETIYRINCSSYWNMVYFAGNACPKCWYDLDGNYTPVLCGDADSEGNLVYHHPNFVWPAGFETRWGGRTGLPMFAIGVGGGYSSVVEFARNVYKHFEENCFSEGYSPEYGIILKNEPGKFPNIVGDYSLGDGPGDLYYTCLTVS